MDKNIDRGLQQLDAVVIDRSIPEPSHGRAIPSKVSPSTSSKQQASNWPTPEPLPELLKSVEPFDVELLPEALQPWADDIAERMQCPGDFIGVSVMVALGTVIGRRVGIRPKQHDTWTEYPNLWGCCVGRPGVMKSPAMTAALAPLTALGKAATRRYEDELASFEMEQQLHDMRLQAQKKNTEKRLAKDPGAPVNLERFAGPSKPALRRYVVNDATTEALLDICIENPQGVCAFRDELVSLLKSLERDGQEGARGFFLTGWNGNASHVSDRIGRGRHMRAEAVCLSMLGSTQPGRISAYLHSATRGGAGDDGLIQRFGLLVWPDIGGNWRNVDQTPDPDVEHRAFAVFDKLDVDDPVADWGAEIFIDHQGKPIEGQPPYLRLDAEASNIFLNWRTDLEQELRSGTLHPAMESHFAKFRKVVPSLALICHLADGGRGAVGVKSMTRALAWAHYLRSHAERAYASVTLADVAGARMLLKRLLNGDVADGFVLRDIYRKEWSMLGTADEAAKAIAILIEHGWLRSQVQHTDGRSKTIYCIHPEVRP